MGNVCYEPPYKTEAEFREEIRKEFEARAKAAQEKRDEEDRKRRQEEEKKYKELED